MEKKGSTEKLRYDFNESRCCEIWIDKLNRYTRVTAREFRSFGGKRRILYLDWKSTEFYEEYDGPVYWFGTNKKVPSELIKPEMMFINNQDLRAFGIPRKHENFVL
jgi:hypothetical protein